MATRVLPDAVALWRQMVTMEVQTGQIPLPVVDELRLEVDRPPVITLLAPELIPGALHVFVDVEHLPPADLVTLESLLQSLQELTVAAGVEGPLRAIYHCGGLDYEFQNTRPLRLRQLPEDLQPLIWGILAAIAQLGARHPDRPASTVRSSQS